MKTESDEYDWGIIINFRQQNNPDDKKRKQIGKTPNETNPLKAEGVLIVDVLLHVDSDPQENKNNLDTTPKPCPAGKVI